MEPLSEAESDARVRDLLRWSLQALAAEASIQCGLFPHFVNVTAELANGFNDAFLAMRHPSRWDALADETRRSLIEIDRRLTAYSRGGDEFREEFWDREALDSDPAWVELRTLARPALEAMSWKPQPIPPCPAVFIPG